MTAILETDEARVHFGGVKAVDGVTLDLQPGLLYGLVGPNGSGKTTLVNAMSRLTPLTGGAIRFDGADVSAERAHAVSRRGMARTFQAIRLLEGLSVRENVMLGADRSRDADRGWRGRVAERRRVGAVADAAIERLSLGDVRDASPRALSYGTQRRVEIARALAGDPKVLLLDEPVAGMNRSEREEIGDIIRSLRAEGLTQLLIEHDLRMILALCDELYVMNFGRCIARGEPRATAALPEVQECYLGRRHVNA
jgi:ABC-type branched-subunit amino acid transport system ATPase component